MLRFAEQFSDKQMVIAFSQKLRWSYFIELLPIKNHDAMIFYANQVNSQLMSVRGVRKQIKKKTFECTEIANLQILFRLDIFPSNINAVVVIGSIL